MAEVKKYPLASGDDYHWGGLTIFDNTEPSMWIGDNGDDPDLNVGFRFPNVTIPQGAIIESAHLTLFADDYFPGTLNVTVYGNNVDNAIAPTTKAGADGLALTAGVAWNNVPEKYAAESFDTPDIKAIIQAILNRAGWVSGNAIQIVIRSTGQTAYRRVRSYDFFGTTYDPELHIEYFSGTALDFDSAPIDLNLSMEGEVFAPAGLNQTIQGLICEGSLAVRSGTLDQILPGFTLVASGGVGTYASLDQNLPGFLIEARSGHFGNITLAALLAEGAGLTGGIGRISGFLPGLVISASGKAAQIASLDRVLNGLEIQAHGYSEVLGRVDRVLPGFTVFATGHSGSYAWADLPLPGFMVVASTIHENRLNADLILPGFFITAEGQAVPVFLTCIVMNPKNLAVSEYTGWNFNSFAFFNGKYLGASSAGIHILEGDTDNGEPIISLIKTGHIPTESARARDIYLMGRSDAQMRVTLIGDEEEESREEADYLISKLGQDRVVTPRGLDPVYLQIAIENSQGGDFDLDSIQVFGEALKRRKR